MDPGKDPGKNPGRNPGKNLGGNLGRNPGRKLWWILGRILGGILGRILGGILGGSLGGILEEILGGILGVILGGNPGRNRGLGPCVRLRARKISCGSWCTLCAHGLGDSAWRPIELRRRRRSTYANYSQHASSSLFLSESATLESHSTSGGCGCPPPDRGKGPKG